MKGDELKALRLTKRLLRRALALLLDCCIETGDRGLFERLVAERIPWR